jgi:hypothetical protein
MKTTIHKLTEDDCAKLRLAVQSLPETPPGRCLTEDQFLAYVDATLPEDEVRVLDEHVAACRECAFILERLFAGQERTDPDPPIDILELLISALRSAASEVRLEALEALAALGQNAAAPSVFEALAQCAQDGVEAVRKRANDVLARLHFLDFWHHFAPALVGLMGQRLQPQHGGAPEILEFKDDDELTPIKATIETLSDQSIRVSVGCKLDALNGTGVQVALDGKPLGEARFANGLAAFKFDLNHIHLTSESRLTCSLQPRQNPKIYAT